MLQNFIRDFGLTNFSSRRIRSFRLRRQLLVGSRNPKKASFFAKADTSSDRSDFVPLEIMICCVANPITVSSATLVFACGAGNERTV